MNAHDHPEYSERQCGCTTQPDGEVILVAREASAKRPLLRTVLALGQTAHSDPAEAVVDASSTGPLW